MKKLVLVTLLAATLLTGCSKKAAVKERTLNIGIQPSAAFIPLYVAREKGWIEEALVSSQVKVTYNDFESGPPMNEGLAAGILDIVVTGDVPTVSAIAAGQKVEVVGIPGNGPDAYAMLARADDNSINSGADLKGKKVATVVGSTGHNLTKKILEKYGMTFDDIEFINIGAGEVGIVLSTGQVDAAVIWEPNVTRLTDNGTAKVIEFGSATNLTGTNTFLARSAYVKENQDVISVVLEQYARAVEALPTLDAETLQKVADDLKLTPDQIKKILPKYDSPIKVEKYDIDGLQDTIKFLVSIEKLSEEYKLSDHVNNGPFDKSGAKKYLK